MNYAPLPNTQGDKNTIANFILYTLEKMAMR